MWYTNIRMADSWNDPLEAFPTRTQWTGSRGELASLADFTPAQHLQAVAAHEFGHFLVNWKLGAHMTEISLQDSSPNPVPRGMVSITYAAANKRQHALVGSAAGERACDRWLREEGLWTLDRSLYAEIQGKTDRRGALDHDPSITFDGGSNDYRKLQDEADAILDEVWPLLRSGLTCFDGFARYTGDQMCALLGIDNNPAS